MKMDLTEIGYIATVKYFETFDISEQIRKQNKSKVEWTLFAFDEFLKDKKLRDKYPEWETFLLRENPLKIYRLKRPTGDSVETGFELMVNRVELPMGSECIDCKEPLELDQYYTPSSKQSRCTGCLEKETEKRGLGRYLHSENSILIRTAKPFVDANRLGGDLRPKSDK